MFTPDFAYVIDPSGVAWEKSQKIQQFVELCCKAYNAVRKNGSIILNLFSLVSYWLRWLIFVR